MIDNYDGLKIKIQFYLVMLHVPVALKISTHLLKNLVVFKVFTNPYIRKSAPEFILLLKLLFQSLFINNIIFTTLKHS